MAIPLDPVSLAIQGAQTVFGIGQAIKGKRMARDAKRPTYEIPEEIKQNLSQAQMMAMEGLPEEQKNQYIQNLQRAGNFALGAMSDRKAGLAGLGSLVQNQQDAYTGLLSADAQAKRQNQQALMQQRSVMGDYKDKAFELNKMEPYQQKVAESQALIGAGLQNIGGGLGSMAQGLQQRNLYNSLQGDEEQFMGGGLGEYQKYLLRKKQTGIDKGQLPNYLNSIG